MVITQNIEKLLVLYREYGDIKAIMDMAEQKGISTNRVTISNCLNGKHCNSKIIQLIGDFYTEKQTKLQSYGK